MNNLGPCNGRGRPALRRRSNFTGKPWRLNPITPRPTTIWGFVLAQTGRPERGNRTLYRGPEDQTQLRRCTREPGPGISPNRPDWGRDQPLSGSPASKTQFYRSSQQPGSCPGCRSGRTEEAIEHFQYVLRLKPDFTEAYFNLALLYAMMHKSSDAIETGQKALELAQSKNQAALAKKIEDWLNNYRSGQPNRSK